MYTDCMQPPNTLEAFGPYFALGEHDLRPALFDQLLQAFAPDIHRYLPWRVAALIEQATQVNAVMGMALVDLAGPALWQEQPDLLFRLAALGKDNETSPERVDAFHGILMAGIKHGVFPLTDAQAQAMVDDPNFDEHPLIEKSCRLSTRLAQSYGGDGDRAQQQQVQRLRAFLAKGGCLRIEAKNTRSMPPPSTDLLEQMGMDITQATLTASGVPTEPVWWTVFMAHGAAGLSDNTTALLHLAQSQGADVERAQKRRQWWRVESIVRQWRHRSGNIAELARSTMDFLRELPNGPHGEDDAGRLLWLKAAAMEPALAQELGKEGLDLTSQGSDGWGLWDVLTDPAHIKNAGAAFVPSLLARAPFRLKEGHLPILHTLDATTWAGSQQGNAFIFNLFEHTQQDHLLAWVGGHIPQRRLGLWLLEKTTLPLHRAGICHLLKNEGRLYPELRAGVMLGLCLYGGEFEAHPQPLLDAHWIKRARTALEELPNPSAALALLAQWDINDHTIEARVPRKSNRL